MSKKSEVMKIWQECFPEDSPRWRRMFFDAAYVDDEALTASDPETGATVSSLLLLPYSMTFQGSVPGVAYIYGAGTLRKFRARGYMGRLMHEALREAADRGDTFATLVPASEALRAYYKRFGFSTVFFSRPLRYTSIHHFPYEAEYATLDSDSPGLFAAFERLMAERPCCIQHTRAQFLTLMDDARLSGHGFAAVGNPETGEPLAMVWAAPEPASDTLRVKELLSTSSDASNAVLTALQRQFPDRPLTLMTQPSRKAMGGNLIPGGMARVVNAESALEAVAANNPATRLTIRLTDPILTENTGVYMLRDGQLTVTDSAGKQKPDLDITPEVLTSLLFSSDPIASIMGLPASRPHMSLMLD